MDEMMNNRNTSAEPLISRYLHAKGTRLGLPVSGTFELTKRCNFNCGMCYIHSGTECRDALNARQWLDIAGQAKNAGVLFLLLTGGEPFIRRDFTEIYEKLSGMGFILSLNTNASLYGGDIRELLKRNKPSRVNVSLYGADDETYKAVTGVPAFTRVRDNILQMKEDGLCVRLNCSFTPMNCADMEKLHRFAEDNGLFVKATTYMYPKTRITGDGFGSNEGRFTPAAAAEYRLKYDLIHYGREEFDKRFNGLKQGILSHLPDCIDPSEDGEGVRCRAGRAAFWINAEGEMSACGMLNGLCSVTEKSFDECWKLVRESTAKIRLPAECADCRYRHFCNVCAAVCYCETGDFGKTPPYVCEMSRLTPEIEI